MRIGAGLYSLPGFLLAWNPGLSREVPPTLSSLPEHQPAATLFKEILVRSLQYIRTELKIQMAKSALVFGASGVSGWAFVNELLHDYPRPETFQKIHAFSNRPLSHATSQWPCSPLLYLVSGIDVLNGIQEDLETAFQRIEGIEDVTHVYYLGMQ
jgi:hypothetical protein